MTNTRRPLTAGSTVGDWLAHPEGGAALRHLLEQGGVDAAAMAPVRDLPLRQLVELSRGTLPMSAVDALVLQVNGGTMPADDDAAGWRERIVPGRFDGTTIVVTGAASGIGRATASRIAREGGRVIAADITGAGLEQLAADLDTAGVDADALVPVTADITRIDGVERIVAAAGPVIDGLANVAGVVDDFSPVHETSDEMWRRVFAVNVDAVFALTRAVLPAMLGAGRGSIVNIASEAALRGNAAGAAYTASKHAVIGITKNSAFMYGPHGIRVNAIAPGGVATGMGGHGRSSEFGRERTADFLRLIPPVASAQHLAASVTFLLSDDGVNISGAVLPSDGGWSVQ
ncbi:SDR family NAD(P)-dependent oxidoreductase [Pseudonocardia kunmingensis]|uniref:NAD(P)-dependent dehydrogenase (Short-subunit alcohol dehydrogenase family) n=1 Tax=Pseudonocardia kunmingensis TaxID=630975 RepID=A0A543CXD0_9PSEU|nr:SDR family NAD(P)-dependent oxidoreductase [Pseudonocardia kunmingensis]TQM01767.1 NAD(P)-dependent dehydrogenase (short-subunit alcohol dehydrogenase family) [Pseudonocardia kunmingensis]